MTALKVPVRLPQPHEKQRQVIASAAKRKVVVAGRRVGKTTMSAMMAVQYMLQGKRVLYAAPSDDQTEAFWGAVTLFLGEAIQLGIVTVNKTRRLLLSRQGGRIRAKTAWTPDLLRGDMADLLILDEYSVMEEETWTQVGAPMMLDTNGDTVFIFTPKRKNHAFKVFLRARADTTGRWACWQFTSHDNPHLSEAAMAEITEDMTDEDYQQEILAEFLESAGQVFRNVDACTRAPVTQPDEHADHVLVAGVDWGKRNDFTAISVGCATCHREVLLDRYNQVDYTLQTARLEQTFSTWRVRTSLAELNAMGEPLVEQLQRDGVQVIGWQTTPQNKPGLIENLALTLERGTWQFLDNPVAKAELEAYEAVVSETTGRRTYSAPSGMHDDTVIARALMLLAAKRQPERPRQIKQRSSPLLEVKGLF